MPRASDNSAGLVRKKLLYFLKICVVFQRIIMACELLSKSFFLTKPVELSLACSIHVAKASGGTPGLVTVSPHAEDDPENTKHTNCENPLPTTHVYPLRKNITKTHEGVRLRAALWRSLRGRLNT